MVLHGLAPSADHGSRPGEEEVEVSLVNGVWREPSVVSGKGDLDDYVDNNGEQDWNRGLYRSNLELQAASRLLLSVSLHRRFDFGVSHFVHFRNQLQLILVCL